MANAGERWGALLHASATSSEGCLCDGIEGKALAMATQVGNGDLTENEQRSHFALWSLLKSPLFIGADLRKLSKPALKILTASEVIAVNQDPLGVAGDLIWKEGPLEVIILKCWLCNKG